MGKNESQLDFREGLIFTYCAMSVPRERPVEKRPSQPRNTLLVVSKNTILRREARYLVLRELMPDFS
jgi:hypothetical protein